MNGTSLDVSAAGSGVRVFEAKQRVGLQAAGFIAGGVLFFLMLIVQFLLALGSKSTPSNDMMPGIIGGLSVFGIALIGRGIFLLRGVTRVVLEDGGVRVEGFIARRSVPYQQIERIERDKQTQMLAGKTNQVLLLRAAGEKKPLALIPDTVENFEVLAAELAARTAAAQGGRTTYDPVTDQQVRQTREAKQLKWASLGLCVFTLLFIAAFSYGLYEEVHERRLKSSGTTVDARINQRFMRRVTPYLNYSFRDKQGIVHAREVMVTEEAYAATEGAKTVPVVYLADDPTWNRPVVGNASESMGGKKLLLFGFGALMTGALAVMALLGIDIKTENGRTRLVRRGQVIREFGPQPPTPPALPPLPRFDDAHATVPTLAADEGDEDDENDERAAAACAAAASSATPFPPPPGAVSPPPPPPPARPKGLLALGVLCIIFGLLGVAIGTFRWAIDASIRTRTMEVGEQVMVVDQPSFAAHWAVVDAALAAALILTGVGLILLKPWSRTIGLPVAALQILSSLAAAGMIIATMSNEPEASGPGSMTVVTLNITAIIARLITAIFPTILLFILAKRSTGEALAGDDRKGLL